eukprot:gene29829-38985_t
MSWDQLESWLQQESTTTSATPLDLMIDDLEMLELLAPSAAAARKFLSACIYRMMQQSLGSQKLERYAVDIRNIVAFGRQAIDSDVDMRSYSLNLTQGNLTLSSPATASDLSARAVNHCRMDAIGEPVLADVVVSVSPLESGFSSEIHGILRTSVSNPATLAKLLKHRKIK